jgi:heme/copper-type cytochrome/quinol oxidase subunit 2
MKATIVIGILILLVAGFFFFNQGSKTTGATITGSSVGVPDKGSSAETSNAAVQTGVREIIIDANSFTFTPAVVKVKEGERVSITVRNVDKTHGISIPAFSARGIESVEFVASKKGNYPFYCATYCGSGHRDMQGTIIVE